MAAPGALTNVVSNDDGGSPTSISVSGMGTATNDRIAICVTGADRASSIGVDTAGWTLLNATTTNGVTIAVAYEAGSTDDSVQFSWTTGTSAAIIAGISPDTDFSSTAPAMNTNAASSTSGGTHTMPSVAWTPTGDDVRIISINALSDARRSNTGYPDADNNTVTAGSGPFDAELAIATGGYTASSPQSPGDFTWSGSINGATQGVVLFEDTGAGSQTISPTLVTQTATATAPQLNMNMAPTLVTQTMTAIDPQLNLAVAPALASQAMAATDPQLNLALSFDLVSQLMAATDPTVTLDNAQQLDPALEQQLMAATAPQINMAIATALVTQTMAATAPQLNMGITTALAQQLAAATAPQVNLNVAPALEQQLAAATEPTVSLDTSQQLDPALAQQLLAATAPQIDMAIAAALVTQAMAATDPQLDLALSTALVQQLVTAYDPTVTPGTVTITTTLAQQLVTAIDPTVSAFAITPALVQQLMAASAPTVASVVVAVVEAFVTGRASRPDGYRSTRPASARAARPATTRATRTR